jgi:hypothetical protein
MRAAQVLRALHEQCAFIHAIRCADVLAGLHRCLWALLVGADTDEPAATDEPASLDEPALADGGLGGDDDVSAGDESAGDDSASESEEVWPDHTLLCVRWYTTSTPAAAAAAARA